NTMDTAGGRSVITKITGASGCAACDGDVVGYQYDDDGRITQKEYANGRKIDYRDFDAKGRAETVVYDPDTEDELTITYTRHPAMDALLSRSQPSVLGAGTALTIWDYDDDGNTVPNENPTRLVHRKIEQGFTRDSQGATVPHETVTAFTYDAKGQVLTIDGPLTGFQDRTEFQYDPVTGDLLSATHPLGGTTWFSNYDPAGRPKRVTDPNGAITSLTHDPMGRPATVTRQSDGACRTHTYNPAGEMATVTLENGATYSFTYDNVYGRLIRTTD
ncbi:MAG: RHS repeat protein, partial [Desulfobacterales bacterium]|nr:RHS repeat protein [Desulfobacterales bacterium]